MSLFGQRLKGTCDARLPAAQRHSLRQMASDTAATGFAGSGFLCLPRTRRPADSEQGLSRASSFGRIVQHPNLRDYGVAAFDDALPPGQER